MPELTPADISEVYRRMSRLYGHKFVSNFGTSDDGTWLMALKGLQQDDLIRGMNALMTLVDEWPPSVPQFKQLCLGVKKKDIQIRAEQLAISQVGGKFNYNQLSEKECRRRIRELLEQATEEVVNTHLVYATEGKLEEYLKLPYADNQQKLASPVSNV